MASRSFWIIYAVLGVGLGVFLATTEVSVPAVYGLFAIAGIILVVADDLLGQRKRSRPRR